MRVVICGGGAIGAAIAYYASQRGIEAIVVERTGVACAASGKSGGFLALDWCDGSALGPLARRSFQLHGELAAAGEGAWDYRRLETLGVVASARRDLSRHRQSESPGWLAEGAAVHGRLGEPESTAQVHPAKFTQGLMAAARRRGAELRAGVVTGLASTADGSAVTGAIVDGETVPADAVVVAMGPWSVLACAWLPLPAVGGLKGHSLVFEYTPERPSALFVECEVAAGEVHAPEVFPRPDGTTYVCGLPGEGDLPVDPGDVGTEPKAEAALRAMVATFAPELARARALAFQACYRPITRDGLPLIGQVGGIEGAYVATGHNVWGILNAPATGEAMAELLAEGRSSQVDLAAFDPGRLPASAPPEVHAASAARAPRSPDPAV